MSVSSERNRRRFSQRRELLRLGALSLFGLTSTGLSRAAEGVTGSSFGGTNFGRAKRCILLFMWGGPAHQDTWDMKPGAPAEIRGEFKPIATNVPGIQICEHFPELSKRIDRLAIVRSMTHTDVNHTTATHFLLTGEPPPPAPMRSLQWPHMGSVLTKLGRGESALPPFVSMRPKLENDVPRFVEQSQGQFSGWLGSQYDPLTIDSDPSRTDYHVGDMVLQPELNFGRLKQRRDLLHELNRGMVAAKDHEAAIQASQSRAFNLLTSGSGEQSAFDLSQEPTSVRERYGMNPHGQSVLQARRLVERGVPLVTVFWPNDGIKNVSVYWDTHSRNFVDLKERLMPVADRAFSALLDDLSDRGMLDDTLVIWTGEFGRTPKIGQVSSDAGAGRDGRDHWPGCFTSVLAGGGVRGGMVYGRSDRQAAYPADRAVAPRDLIATVYHLLGVPDGQAVNDTTGRTRFVRPGEVIPELFG